VVVELLEVMVRSIGVDVHRDFSEVAIREDGVTRSAGRIETSPEQLELFAHSLAATDRGALEATGNAWSMPRSPSPASWPCWPGTCSPAARTTPSPVARWSRASGAGSPQRFLCAGLGARKRRSGRSPIAAICHLIIRRAV
jgi:hypothetical protein